MRKPLAERTSKKSRARRPRKAREGALSAPASLAEADTELCFLPMFLLFGLGSGARAANRRGYGGTGMRGPGGFGGYPYNGAGGYPGMGGFRGPAGGFGGQFPWGGGMSFGGQGSYPGGANGQSRWPFGGRSFMF